MKTEIRRIRKPLDLEPSSEELEFGIMGASGATLFVRAARASLPPVKFVLVKKCVCYS